MAAPLATPGSAPGTRSALVGRDFLLLLTSTLLAFSNFSPLLSVLPLWSAGSGTGHGGLGGITGVMMAATVGVQFFMPWVLARFGLRPVLAAGGLLLGAPTLAYTASPDLAWVLPVSAVRGVGFGMFVVAGSAMLAALVPRAQRGKAVGIYGVAVGVPYVLVLPAAVYYAQTAGFAGVFVLTGVASMLIAPLVALIRAPRPAEPGDSRCAAPTRPVRALTTPWAALCATACAMGGATAFLTLALPDAGTASAALLVLSVAVIAGRWGAGVAADRMPGVGGLVLPGLVAGALGMGVLAAAAGAETGAAVLALAGAALYGAGFGVVQNDTLVVMFHRAGPQGANAASTVWNVGYDAGAGAGSVVIGLLAAGLGIAGAFGATALAMVLIAPLVWRDTRRHAHGAPR